jgi:hypothetical protein
MKYSTEFNEINSICTIQVTRDFLRPDDSLLLRQIIRDLAIEQSHRLFLCDLTQAEIKGKWTDAAPAITGYDDPKYKMATAKTALVYSSNLSDNKLLESTASTQGYLISVFDDIAKAIEWLKL